MTIRRGQKIKNHPAGGRSPKQSFLVTCGTSLLVMIEYQSRPEEGDDCDHLRLHKWPKSDHIGHELERISPPSWSTTQIMMLLEWTNVFQVLFFFSFLAPVWCLEWSMCGTNSRPQDYDTFAVPTELMEHARLKLMQINSFVQNVDHKLVKKEPFFVPQISNMH